VGGLSEIEKALTASGKELDEKKLRKYAARIGNSAVSKRLGFLMETLGLGNVEALRRETDRASGFSPLDPTLPKRGKYNRRWGLLVNVEIQT
jgi:predicted transcriptional regulator of viral defense system